MFAFNFQNSFWLWYISTHTHTHNHKSTTPHCQASHQRSFHHIQHHQPASQQEFAAINQNEMFQLDPNPKEYLYIQYMQDVGDAVSTCWELVGWPDEGGGNGECEWVVRLLDFPMKLILRNLYIEQLDDEKYPFLLKSWKFSKDIKLSPRIRWVDVVEEFVWMRRQPIRCW